MKKIAKQLYFQFPVLRSQTRIFKVLVNYDFHSVKFLFDFFFLGGKLKIFILKLNWLIKSSKGTILSWYSMLDHTCT